MILPIVTLIGRKNVGKSTLFNRLTGTYDALVSSYGSGLTRDRRYGSFHRKGYQFVIVDTGGIDNGSVKCEIDVIVYEQSINAISESNLVLFIVDGRVGLMPGDREIVHFLYKFQKSIFVVVNKIDHSGVDNAKFEFYSLGIEKIISVSAMYGYGVDFLSEEIFLKFYNEGLICENANFDDVQSEMFLKNPSCFIEGKRSDIIRLAVIGAPNVGKSTFINYILGENRMVVSQLPGTTRDSISVSMIYHGYKWIIVDTAGVRKRNKISSVIEEMSVINTLKVIQNVGVVLLLINADLGVSGYDLSLLSSVLRSGKSLVIGMNKCDLLSHTLKEKYKLVCNARMHFIHFVTKKFISSVSGHGICALLQSIIEVHHASFRLISTSSLTRVMQVAVSKRPPPRIDRRQIKLKYAHIGGRSPCIVVVHGDHVTGLPKHYKRYLINCFSDFLKIPSLSICVQFNEQKR